jgi:uncharacterized membrane protein
MFDLTPLWAEEWPIPPHALAAMAALVIGSFQLILPKGTARHRVFGYLWAALLLFVAVSSFWIHEIRMVGDFSPIHLLSVLVLFTVPMAVYSARKGDVSGHRKAMTQLFWVALVITGLFTLLPGRVLHNVVFGV